MIERWYTDEFIEARPDIVQRRLGQIVGMDAGIFLNVFRIYAGTEMLPWLHDVKARSLVLTGEFDGGCNPRLNQLIADALLLEAPDDVLTHMLRFNGG